MKRLVKLSVLAALLLLGAGLFAKPAAAQNTQAFTIKSFSADYYLSENAAKTSTLHTDEVIVAQFPGYDQNHGILRAIPEDYQGHTVSLVINSVTNADGVGQTYTTSKDNGNLVLKIGDANTYVHGLQTYKISYDAKNVVSILSNQDEFYWDVNGDQWTQPFDQVTARVHILGTVSGQLQDRVACYAGVSGSTDQSRCQINSPVNENSGKIVIASAQNLNSGENLTLVTAFNPGTFVLGPEIAQAKRAAVVKFAVIAGGTLALPVAAAVYAYIRWRKYGRDPKGRGAIIPEYQPPKGLNALTSDYIFKEALNNKAISALIVELAIRKYVTIYEVNVAKKLRKDTKTYKLKLIKAIDDLTAEEQIVVKMFFGDAVVVGQEVDIAELKNKLSSDVTKLKKSLGASLLTAGYFTNDPNKAGTHYYLAGLILFVSGFYVITVYPPAGISLILAGAIFFIVARYMPARSQAGTDVHDHMLGLRDYIKLAEADRLKFLQSPEGAEKIQEVGLDPNNAQFKVKLFESLLPYAMLFNFEKDWAKQFQDVYTSPPGWYNGNWSTFNTVYLVSSLSGFNTASAVTFTAPSSSGSSGFGGGFSGGGGGGGGGGGW